MDGMNIFTARRTFMPGPGDKVYLLLIADLPA